MSLALDSNIAPLSAEAMVAEQLRRYPRLRFMGSKYKLAPRLAEVFDGLPAGPAVDAFSGSGVVAYTLKLRGRSVLANDHLAFTARIASALVGNDTETLSDDDLIYLCSGNADGRSFIATTFKGLYFPPRDHKFLDAVWSRLESMSASKQDLVISALCLAAARKQPRGVFTFTTPRYDDGRRHLRMSLEDLFIEAVGELNAAVFEGEQFCSASSKDVFELPADDFALAYFDPPYAPPRDDTCYIKRYHFLEGLATYWRDQDIMWETRTRKLRKRFTPFAYKRTAPDALDRLFGHFRGGALVVSYGSNAALNAGDLEELLSRHRRSVERIEIPHRYAFGTHGTAARRQATEYIYVAE
jgi:DNA adenine methylase/adenine-specific DNA-methyltransferase